MPVRRLFPSVVLSAFLVVIGLAAAAPRALAAPLFAAPYVPYLLDASPYATPMSVAIGDLNGDGKPDIVTADGNAVSVLLGVGDGTFATHTEYPTGALCLAVAIGDVNGDSKPDLVTANYFTGTLTGNVSVLLGTGDGTFGPSTDLATGNLPTSIAIGDLNGDGYPDIVTANSVDSTVTVLAGDGHGNFGSRSDYFTGFGPHSVAIRDVSGDGRPDLVTANYDASTVSVLLANSSGSFYPRTDYGVGTNPRSVAIADLDGDGWPDLVTANAGTDSVTILAGSGFGGFGVRSDFATGINPYSVVIRELNGDGGPDIVTASYNSGAVSVLLRNTDGSYRAPTHFGVGAYPQAVAIGDLDGDGKPDLVTGNYPLEGSPVSVLLGNGDGSFGGRPLDFGVTVEPTCVAVGDLNHDGRPDLVIPNAAGAGPRFAGVMLGAGGGTFDPQHDFDTAGFSFSIALGDLNRDGNLDLVTENYQLKNVSVLLGDGAGNFGPHAEYDVGQDFTYMAVGDLNHDGNPDLVTADYAVDSVSVLLGDGLGHFGPPTEFATGGQGTVSVAIGDLNHDGDPDLVTWNSYANGGSNISVLLGDGHGAFGPHKEYAGGGNLAIGDLNGDGNPDVVTAGYYGGDKYLALLFGNGDGTFGEPTYLSTSPAEVVAIGDLNGDGNPDLVTTSRAINAVSVLLGNGNGAFAPHIDYGVSPAPRANPYFVAIGDLNGDGRPDLVIANSGDGIDNPDVKAVSVLLNTGALVDVKPESRSAPLALGAPRPNPFRGRAQYDFSLPTTALVRLEIYDVQGRRMSTLQDGVLAPGHYTRSWDGRTTTGRAALPGLYLARLRTSGVELDRKTVLIH